MSEEIIQKYHLQKLSYKLFIQIIMIFIQALSMGPSQDERVCSRVSECILFEILD